MANDKKNDAKAFMRETRNAFIKSDLRSVAHYVWFEVVVPKTVDVFTSMLHGFVDSMFGGEGYTSPLVINGKGPDYNRISTKKAQATTPKRLSATEVDIVEFDTPEDRAKAIRETLRGIRQSESHCVSVRDYYEFCNHPTDNYMWADRGWYSLQDEDFKLGQRYDDDRKRIVYLLEVLRRPTVIRDGY